MLRAVTSLAAVATLFAAADARAQTAPSDALHRAFTPYMNAADTVRLADGRAIHLVCMGQGSPTVILTSGLGSWSMAWRMVQPTVAETTRVCAWDRAGVGFSDPDDQTQTVEVTTTDLEAALAAADIHGPYIVVGHSMGAYETLLFADRRRAEIAGMVLVDPSIPDQAAGARAAVPAITAVDEADMAEAVDKLRRCAVAVAEGSVTLSSLDPEGCLAGQPTFPPALIAALAALDLDPNRHLTRASLMENFPASSRMVVNLARDYGDLPLIVLTAGNQPIPDDSPPAILAERPAYIAAWTGGHDALAALSTRGVNRTVPDSGHSIQREQPAAVIAAILEVVAAARSPQ